MKGGSTLRENKKVFDYLNITDYHEKGYKGQGVKILVYDANFDIRHTHLTNIIPADRNSLTRWEMINDNRRNEHGLKSVDLIRQIAPEAEIHFMGSSHILNALKYAKEKKIDIVSVSMSFYNDAYIEQASNEISSILISAAGNKGREGVTVPANQPSWVAVGASELVNGKPVRIGISSVGRELEVMSLTNNQVRVSSGKIETYKATSGACPVVAGMTALYFSVIGKKLKREEYRQFIYENCHDLEEKGRDKNTGYGLFVLPKIEGEKTVKQSYDLPKGYPTAKVKYSGKTVNAIIIEGRTYVQVRDLGETMGLKVGWEQATSTVTLD